MADVTDPGRPAVGSGSHGLLEALGAKYPPAVTAVVLEKFNKNTFWHPLKYAFDITGFFLVRTSRYL